MDLYRWPKKTRALQPEDAEIITTYTPSIDRRAKGEQLGRHAARQVWTQVKGKTATFGCLYTTDEKCTITLQPSCPHLTSPFLPQPPGSTTGVFCPVRFTRTGTTTFVCMYTALFE